MPVIVFVSPKGGVGKTTASVLLADRLSEKTKVAIIDADPNRPVQRWAENGNASPNLTVLSNVNEENIIDVIEDAARRAAFVVVDLEGTANKIVLLAVSQADIVLIPTQGSQLDAEQANRAIKVVRQQEKMSRRRVPYALLFTRTGTAVKTRSLTHLVRSLEQAGIPALKTQLNEREAFRAVFSFRQRLSDLDPSDVANIDKALANVDALVKEVLELLREERAVAAA